MMMGGDFDFTSSQRYSDSLKEVLKQTMLGQEVIFRRQVNELHRLYAIQKSLMNGNGCGLDPFADHMKCNLLAVENTVPRIPMGNAILLGSAQSTLGNNFLQEGRVICSRLQQRPRDLFHLPMTTSNSINYIYGHLLKGSNDLNTGQTLSKHYLHDDQLPYEEELNLCLSIGRTDTRRKCIGRKAWNYKKTCPYSPEIIDLEDLSEDESTKTAFSLVCAAAPVISVSEHNLEDQGHCHQNFTGHLVKDLSHRMNESSVDGSEFCQERSSIGQGSSEWHADVKRSIKQFTSYEATGLDLNKKQFDEPSFYTNELFGANPSPGSSSGTSLRQPKSNDMRHDNSAKGNKVCTIDLESLPDPSSDLSKEPFHSSTNSENGMIELPLRSQDNNAIPEVNRGKGEERFAELNFMAREAALSLVSISLQGRARTDQDGDCIMNSGSNQVENENKGRKKPLHCLDSYEALVLSKLEESVVDECGTSKPFEINEMDTNKDSPIKLRRGRRIKDFQKDILPTLSSLSRHEIWEDMKIMEGAIRSREYKKFMGKSGHAENWFTPAKSRRSKLNYVGRRRYS